MRVYPCKAEGVREGRCSSPCPSPCQAAPRARPQPECTREHVRSTARLSSPRGSHSPRLRTPRNPHAEVMTGLGLAGLSPSACRLSPSASLGPCGACVQRRLWERVTASERPIAGGLHADCATPPCSGSAQALRREGAASRACEWLPSSFARGPFSGGRQASKPAGGLQLLVRGLWHTSASSFGDPLPSSVTGRQLFRAHASLAQREEPLGRALGAQLQREGGGGVTPGEGAKDQQSPASGHFFADPRVTWQSLGVSEAVEEALCRGGFSRPSAIQAVAVPHIVKGGDAVIAAETGSGKTHTYLAAIAQRAHSGFVAGAPGDGHAGERPRGESSGGSGTQGVPGVQEGEGRGEREGGADTVGLVGRSEEIGRGERRPRGHRFALVLCPNATLCRQVMEMALHLRDSSNRPLLSVEAVVGGEGWPSEPPQVVVATPAALMNQLFAADPRRRRRAAFVRDLAMLVVDEADMLLSGGYARQVTRLLGLLRLEEREQAEAQALEAREYISGQPAGDAHGAPERADASGMPGPLSSASRGAGNEGGADAPFLDEASRPWTDFLPPEEEGHGGGEPASETQEERESSAVGQSGSVAESTSSRDEGAGEEGDDAGYEVAEEEWEEGLQVGAAASGGQEGEEGLGWIHSPGTVVHRKGAALLEGLGRRALKRRGFARSKQYVFVAATMPESGKRTVGQVLQWQFPEATWISGRHLHRRVPSAKAEWLPVDEDTRAQVLLSLLGAAPGAPAAEEGAGEPSPAVRHGHTLVFANSVDSADAIGRLLTARGVPCSVFHKDVPAAERALTLLRFQGVGAGTSLGSGPGNAASGGEAGEEAEGASGPQGGVLVCTDAASRGVDIPNVTHVIQAEFALSAVDFLHRIGRTARAGQSGRVTSLYSDANEDLVQAVRSALEAGAPVDTAFSRKRSFKKKLKKFRRAG